VITVRLDRSVGIASKLAELWAYRELMRNMVMRDLKARYKQSILGYFWSLLNPLMTMLIFWLVFSVLLRNDIPMFPIFLLVASCRGTSRSHPSAAACARSSTTPTWSKRSTSPREICRSPSSWPTW
jgi:hypothetical protein